MSKKWKAIFIISMVFLGIEIIGSMFFLFPYYRMQRVFNSIDAGQWEATEKYYNSLSSSQRSTVDSYLDGYGAYLTKEYTDGEISYKQVSASFDAINSITADTTIYDKYTPDINRNEYVKLMNSLYTSDLEKNTDEHYATIAKVTEIQNRISSDVRESILIEMLNYKLDRFVAEEITYDDMKIFTDIAESNSINSANDYAITVAGYADNINYYRDEYQTVSDLLANQKYLDAIDLIDSINVYDFDANYTNLYQTAYQTAYDTGKEYYQALLQSYINSNDTENAVTLMAELEKLYGDDFDLDFAKDAMMTDWQKACVTRVEDWEDYLSEEIEDDDDLTDNYDFLKPDSIALYDLDGDDVPELFMFNSANVEDDYIGTFVFAYNDKEYDYAGFVNIISFGIKSNIVAFPLCFDRTPGEEVCLYNFDGTTVSEGESAQKIGDKYYINGADATDIDYLSEQTAILLNQSTDRIQNSDYVELSDYKEYIIGYTGK